MDWRFRVALVIAHETGHRIGAIRQLRWSDIDMEGRTIRWRAQHEKTGHEHRTPVTAEALDAPKPNVPARTRTWGLLLRRQSLYPPELRGRVNRRKIGAAHLPDKWRPGRADSPGWRRARRTDWARVTNDPRLPYLSAGIPEYAKEEGLPMMTSTMLLLLATVQAGPDRIDLEPSRLTLDAGETATVTATVRADDGSVLADATVRWITMSPEIAAVNQAGQVTAVSPGEARIAARTGNVMSFATVVVRALPVEAVQASLPETRMVTGTTVPIRVTATGPDGEAVTAPPLAFSSSDESVAGVDRTGRVYARGAGEASHHGLVGRRPGYRIRHRAGWRRGSRWWSPRPRSRHAPVTWSASGPRAPPCSIRSGASAAGGRRSRPRERRGSSSRKSPGPTGSLRCTAKDAWP